MARARKEQSGGGPGMHVGTRTQVKVDSTYASIANTSTDNRLRCPRCNCTWHEVKFTHNVDRGEIGPDAGYVSAGGATTDCIIMICRCGEETAYSMADTEDWTAQVHS